jgi:hypothetical protein
MKKIAKAFIYACASAIGIAGLAIFAAWVYFKLSYYLPSEQRVRNDFDVHKADYVQFVKLIRKDPSARYIGSDGKVDPDGKAARTVPEYARLIHKIGAQFVIVGDDGSVEFALWGNGCAICSDSYMGILHIPKDYKNAQFGLQPTVVASLTSSKLPQENGSVATGLYVVEIAPDWFAYRFEYQE